MNPSCVRISASTSLHSELRNEVCEHKGIGHPDTICDGAVEAVSRALCVAYREAWGELRHHNVDKALLIGGASSPRFGGGTIRQKARLIIAGRAAALPEPADVHRVVSAAAKEYLMTKLRCPEDLFEIESAVGISSPNLERVLPGHGGRTLSNDTSIGVGFAPYSTLERCVLDTSSLLESPSFHEAFPMAGDDFKIMGIRDEDRVGLTIALAIRDRQIDSCAHYFAVKGSIEQWLHQRLDSAVQLRINTLDDREATKESGIYLTVTGLSAEHGDDGEVGRGNRISRLITPSRPMSLEAVAGKNPSAHVGKIYNIAAHRLANEIVSQLPGIAEAQVQLVSCIGEPIDSPQLVDIRVAPGHTALDEAEILQIRKIACRHLASLAEITDDVLEGKVALF